ncbi:hypothetical protein NPIL_379601 [Nephila pilipes]|uniref:DUF4817 domain-containing protein n=1 Tax=Nephila pilipes TaxID=299642 RepID=A0A8X6J086_NEPPI|nr:hypothetical protein NPIL_379601 [Nephila pilipes]
MERYTAERVFIEQYFKNNEGQAATVRKFRTKYGQNSDLTSSTVIRVIEKNQADWINWRGAKHTGRSKTRRSNVNIEAVRECRCKSMNINSASWTRFSCLRSSLTGKN